AVMRPVVPPGVLCSSACPPSRRATHKSRRSDARVALMQLQMAVERYRSDHSRYGSLVELGSAASTSSGHYAITVAHVSETGFRAQAVASGVQASDTKCHHMQITV